MTWAVNQKTVPMARKTVPPTRMAGLIASRPRTHQQIATSSAARIVKIAWASVASPQSATNGSRTTAGSGGKGSRPRGTPSLVAIGRTSWNQALPETPTTPSTGKRIAA